MMNTREIADHLANAAAKFPFLGPVSADDLIELVNLELGHPERLDRFCPNGKNGNSSRALPHTPLLHIISGNTPHAGLQSLLRGLLVGAHNRVKEPSAGLPELHHFRSLLPPELANRVEISSSLSPHWLAEAEAVIVFGSDETIAHFRSQLRPEQRMIAHGHRLSFGVIFDVGPEPAKIAQAAARDASLYDQQGCLSPHLFYIPSSQAEAFAPFLAKELEAFEQHTPRRPISPEEERDIMALRGETAFRAALDPAIRIWSSPASTAWTLILEAESTRFLPSCLNRAVRLIPLPDKAFVATLHDSVSLIRPYLSTIGVHPCTSAEANIVFPTGASRITPLGSMQFPPLTWHHDGSPVLLPLVHWIDFEETASPSL